MPDRNAPNRAEFAASIAKGVVWGAVAAIAIMTGELVREALSSTQPVNVALYLIVFICALVVMFCVALILGPIAALLSWPIYRRNVRSPTVYALAGAVAAGLPPLAVALMDGSLFEPSQAGAALFYIAWFSLSGAFGGFMAARALQQKAR